MAIVLRNLFLHAHLPFPEFHGGPLHLLLGGKDGVFQDGGPSLIQTLRRHQSFLHFIANHKERIVQGHDGAIDEAVATFATRERLSKHGRNE